jgi:hypothetical protein
MRPRAVPSLANLPVSQYLAALAEGMSLIAEHVATLEAAAARQPARAAAAVRVVADEEAGKYLILLDAARCARRSTDRKVRQLKRCNQHIPKGVYVEAADIRPATFGELLGYIDLLRVSHYLDGPNDVDWIFRNSIEAGREDRLYVDYVETDDGAGWTSPARFDDVWFGVASGATRLVGALDRAGGSTPDGLAIVDAVWHDFVPDPASSWSEVSARNEDTTARWRAAGLGAAAASQDLHIVVDTWTFPLHSTEVERKSADVDELRRRQAAWTPDYGEGQCQESVQLDVAPGR